MTWQKIFLADDKNKELTIVFHDMGLGGVQRKIIDLINYYQKKYPQIKITLYLRHKAGIFLKRVPESVVIKYQKHHLLKRDLFCFVFWLIGRFIKDKPKIILSFMDVASVPVLMASKIIFWQKHKIIIGEDILTSEHIKEETFPRIRLWLIKKLYPKAKKILVQTKIQRDDLIKILGEKCRKKIVTSPNWLPLDFPPKREIKNKRDIDILFIGRIELQKNPIKFVEIIKMLSKNRPKLRVKMIGQGSLLKKVKKKVRDLSLEKIISFELTTSDPIKFYRRSKIFLMTSNYEGFPLTLMEAISCGSQPIVSSMKETDLFFDKYKNKIIFKSKNEAIKILETGLEKSDNQLIAYYKQKIVDQQNNNITKYAGYII